MVLITGPSRGLGLAVARAYVGAGASVVSCARDAVSNDGSWIVQDLRLKGFHVADGGHANYSSTPLSTASTLNLQYLPLRQVNEGYAVEAGGLERAITDSNL